MQKVRKGKVAPNTRKRSNKRSNKKRQGRKAISRSSEKAPRVISHSLFALTLNKKTGTEVLLGLENKLPDEFQGENCFKMYHDLLASYRKGMKLLGKEYSKIDLYQAGVPLHLALGSLLDLFEKDFLPKGYQYNVDFDRNSEEYFFTIYKFCEFPWQWHAFEIKPIVYELRRCRKLFDLFFRFIRCFQSCLNIPFWFQGNMRYHTMEWVVDQELENLLEMEEVLDPEVDDVDSHNEEFIELMTSIDSYFLGEAKYYENIIRNTPFHSPKKLLAELKQYKGWSPEVDFMKEALVLIDGSPSWDKYMYLDYYNEMGEGVVINDQIGVIWDCDDVITGHHGSFLDDEASNCGVMDPIISIEIRPTLKEFSIEKLKDAEKFPLQLSKLYSQYSRLVNHIKEANAKRKN